MRAEDRDLAVTLAVAVVLGFAAGFARAEHQVAVETAQVLAGLVEYPRENPFFVYHMKLWNLGSQLLAIALWLGVPERVLSLALSGVMGALSFQALALCTLAVSRDRWLAIVTPPWILGVSAYALGVSYDIVLLGFPHTYGVIGTGYALLVLALLGLGRTRAGLLLLGLAPAVHPSIGAWTLGVGVGGFLLSGPDGRRRLREHARFLVSGGALAGLSLGAQLWMGHSLDLVTTPAGTRIVRAFVRHWDWHRTPVSPLHPVLALTIGFIGVVLAWLRVPRLRDGLPQQAHVLLAALALSGALGVAFCVATLWQEQLPLALVVAMPGRHVNLSSLALAPLLLGMLGGAAQQPLGARLLLAVAVLGSVGALALEPPLRATWMILAMQAALATLAFWRGVAPAPSASRSRARAIARALAIVTFGVTALVALRPDPGVLLALAAMAGGIVLAIDPPARVLDHTTAPIARRAGAALAVVAMLGCGLRVERAFGSPLGWLRDATNDPLLAKVAEGSGVLLTGSDLGLVQLRTRRPVLLDGSGLDGIPYAIEAAPQMLRILRRVYGEDLLDPSPEIRAIRPGALLADTGAWRWQVRSPAQWTRLAREFGFRDVLTYSSWKLQLPLVAQDAELSLYRVPIP